MERRLGSLLFLFLIVSVMTMACKDTLTDTHESQVEWPELMAVMEADEGEIDSIRFTLYTEGGAMGAHITDAQEIEEACSLLCALTLGKETLMGAEDAGLYMEVDVRGEKQIFQFDAEIAVLRDKRYEVYHLEPLKRYLKTLLAEDPL